MASTSKQHMITDFGSYKSKESFFSLMINDPNLLNPNWFHDIPFEQKKKIGKGLEERYGIIHDLLKECQFEIENEKNEKKQFSLLDKQYFRDFLRNIKQLILFFNINKNDDESIFYQEIITNLNNTIKFFQKNRYEFELASESVVLMKSLKKFEESSDEIVIEKDVLDQLCKNISKECEMIFLLMKPQDFDEYERNQEIDQVDKRGQKKRSPSLKLYIANHFNSFKHKMNEAHEKIISTFIPQLLNDFGKKDKVNNELSKLLNQIHQVINEDFNENEKDEKFETISKLFHEINKILSSFPPEKKALIPNRLKNIIEETKKAYSKYPNGKKRSAERTAFDKKNPWKTPRRRSAKRDKPENSNDDENDERDSKKSTKAVISKKTYQKKHIEKFGEQENIMEILKNYSPDDMVNVATKYANDYIDRYFSELNIDPLYKNIIFEKINLKDMEKKTASSSHHKDTAKFDSFMHYQDVIEQEYNDNKNVLCSSGICIKYNNGVYGDHGHFLLIYVYMDLSGDEIDTIPISPVYVANYSSIPSFSLKTLSQFIRQTANKIVKKGSLNQEPYLRKKMDEEKTAKKKTSSKFKVVRKERKKSRLELLMEPILDKIQLIDNSEIELKFSPNQIKKHAYSLISNFLKEQYQSEIENSSIRGLKELLFQELFDPTSNEIIDDDDNDLAGVIVEPGNKLLVFDHNPKNRKIYLYPTGLSILRRFDTNIERPIYRPYQYQIFLVYDHKNGKILSRKDGEYGYFGYLENPKTYRLINTRDDIDAASDTLTTTLRKDEEDDTKIVIERDDFFKDVRTKKEKSTYDPDNAIWKVISAKESLNQSQKNGESKKKKMIQKKEKTNNNDDILDF